MAYIIPLLIAIGSCAMALACRITLRTSWTLFSLKRSLAVSIKISIFSLCSATSPTIGFSELVGLSFADTQLATGCSGLSRDAFPNMPLISWLWQCSRVGSTQIKRLMRRENSSWFRKPFIEVRSWLRRLPRAYKQNHFRRNSNLKYIIGEPPCIRANFPL